MVRTDNMASVYPLNKFFSVQYFVNYKHGVIQQLSRTYSLREILKIIGLYFSNMSVS